MITLEPGMSVNDIEQWVGGGFFLLKRGDLYTPAEVTWWPERDEDGECFDSEEAQFAAATMEGETARFYAEDARDYIFPHWPICGSVNLLRYKHAAHYERLQMKQWRRTFNWRQIKCTVPQSWHITEGQPRNYTTHECVEYIFSPEYPSSPMELDAWFAVGWKSVALNPNVIVTNTRPLMVYYNGQLAAKINHGVFDPVDVRLTHLLNKLYAGGIRV